MITVSKQNLPEGATAINQIQEAKDRLKKGSLTNNNDSEVPTGHTKEGKERTLALISRNDNLDNVIEYIKKGGFTVIDTKIIQLSLNQAKSFYIYHQSQNYYDKMVRWLSSGSGICALILEKEDAIKDWKFLMGPANYKKARKSNPNSIRALFGKDASQNATHGSDSDASAKKEIEFIFGDTSLDIAYKVDKVSPIDVTDDSRQEQAQLQREQADAASVAISEQKLETAQDENASYDCLDGKPDTENGEILDVANHSNPILPGENNIDKASNKIETLNSSQVTKQATSVVNDVEHNKYDKQIIEENIDTVPISASVFSEDQKDLSDDAPTIEKENISNIAASPQESSQNEESIAPQNPVTALQHESNPTLVATLPTESDKPENVNVFEAAPKKKETAAIPSTSSGTKSNDFNKGTMNNKEDVIVKDAVEDNLIGNAAAPSEESESEGSATAITTIVNNIGEQQSEENKVLAIKSAEPRLKTRSNLEKKTSLPKTKKSNGKEKKKDTSAPNSRITTPSNTRGQNDTKVQSDKSNNTAGRASTRTSVNNNNRANSTTIGIAGATRIARLSPSATINNSNAPVSATMEKKSLTSASNAKKAPTKVSKNLPRVATIPSTQKQQAPTKEEESNEKEKKAKNRLSSTKNFISRLTAPTVASSNKKADNEGTTSTTSGISRRAILPSKKSSTVKPLKSNSSSSTSKDISKSNNKQNVPAAKAESQPNGEALKASDTENHQL